MDSPPPPAKPRYWRTALIVLAVLVVSGALVAGLGSVAFSVIMMVALSSWSSNK